MEASRDSANRPPPTRNLPPLLTGSVGRPRSFVRNTGVPSWAQGSHVTKSNNSPGGWTPPGRSTCGDRGPWSQNTHVGMLGCPDCGPVGLGDQRAQEVWSTPTHTHCLLDRKRKWAEGTRKGQDSAQSFQDACWGPRWVLPTWLLEPAVF